MCAVGRSRVWKALPDSWRVVCTRWTSTCRTFQHRLPLTLWALFQPFWKSEVPWTYKVRILFAESNRMCKIKLTRRWFSLHMKKSRGDSCWCTNSPYDKAIGWNLWIFLPPCLQGPPKMLFHSPSPCTTWHSEARHRGFKRAEHFWSRAVLWSGRKGLSRGPSKHASCYIFMLSRWVTCFDEPDLGPPSLRPKSSNVE